MHIKCGKHCSRVQRAVRGNNRSSLEFLLGVREESPKAMASDEATKVGRGWVARHLAGHIEHFYLFPQRATPTGLKVSLVSQAVIMKCQCLQQQKFICSQFWRLEVCNQQATVAGFWRRLSSWLVDACLLAVSSLD